MKADIAKFRAGNPEYTGPIPADLLTTSASGLDPHISPESAAGQAPRIAKARGVPLSRIQRLIAEYTEGRQAGFFGDPRVNVLKINMALDRTVMI